MTDGIADKVVVITGASSGLGAATARYLAERGARVVLGARRLDRIEMLRDEIRASGGAALAVAVDVARREEVQALIDAAIAEYGCIDVMLNNAGIMPLSPLERLKVDEWDRMVDVNIKGVLHGIAACLPHMMARRSGQIINISSVAGHKVIGSGAVYSATKFAVRALSEGLRQEVKPYDIRTTVISPGAVATDLIDGISEPDIEAAVRARTSFAVPAETFARMVAFAISQPADVDVNEILFRPTQQES